MLLFHVLLLVVSTCWSVSGQGEIPTVPCYGQDCSVTQSTTESATELTPESTTESTTTTSTTTSTTTPSPGTNQRTVVFIYKVTQPGQDLFIRGGIDTAVRPICEGNQNAETSDCAISIQVNSLGVGTHWEKYDAWRVGDTKLDWFGVQAGQGTYMGTPALGTPMAWTTDDPLASGYHELNKWGDAYWMADFTMECSETENGWFDLKAYLTNFGWENDITQSSPCGGTEANVPPPYSGTKNHVARCGYINVFNFGGGGCEINAF